MKSGTTVPSGTEMNSDCHTAGVVNRLQQSKVDNTHCCSLFTALLLPLGVFRYYHRTDYGQTDVDNQFMFGRWYGGSAIRQEVKVI